MSKGVFKKKTDYDFAALNLDNPIAVIPIADLAEIATREILSNRLPISRYPSTAIAIENLHRIIGGTQYLREPDPLRWSSNQRNVIVVRWQLVAHPAP